MTKTLKTVSTALLVSAFAFLGFREFTRETFVTPIAANEPAPSFELVSQDNSPFELKNTEGKTVLLSFAFTRCRDICPASIYKFVWMQDEIGSEFGKSFHFVTISLDPEYDTPEILRKYAQQIGADTENWTFLTGSSTEINRLTKLYGVFARPGQDGQIVHILLTSLIDKDGLIRVQYAGDRFDPEEMINDLRDIAKGDWPA